MKDVHRRILLDFADQNVLTRHTRSTAEEWEANKKELTAMGYLAETHHEVGRRRLTNRYITQLGLAKLAIAERERIQ